MPPKGKTETEVEITVSVSTGISGSRNESTFTVDREEWEAMSDAEKDEVAQDTLFEMISWDWRTE